MQRPRDQSFTTIRGVTLGKSKSTLVLAFLTHEMCVGLILEFPHWDHCKGVHEVDNRDSWAICGISKSQIGIIYLSNIQKSYWHVHSFSSWLELYLIFDEFISIFDAAIFAQIYKDREMNTT